MRTVFNLLKLLWQVIKSLSGTVLIRKMKFRRLYRPLRPFFLRTDPIRAFKAQIGTVPNLLDLLWQKSLSGTDSTDKEDEISTSLSSHALKPGILRTDPIRTFKARIGAVPNLLDLLWQKSLSGTDYESPLGARSFMRHQGQILSTCNAKQSGNSRTYT